LGQVRTSKVTVVAGPRRGSGARALETGKLPHELLVSLLGELPPPPPEVRLGARIGEDACAIDIAGGTLVVTADPITLTSEDAARLCVLVNANDVAVCGARPRWFLAVVLVPPGTTDDAVRALFAALQAAVDELGAALVGGHTEVTLAVNRPIVVGQMLGLVEHGTIVTTAGFGPGDVILQVRPAPIEGAAVLSCEAARRLTGLDPRTLADAQAALESPGIVLVEAALLAAELGARALHDPTEGGLSVGLHEMAAAADVRIRIDRKAVLWYGPGVAVCQALGCDPWSTLASGTLLAAFPAETADRAVDRFTRHGHAAAVIGSVEAGVGVHDLHGDPLPWPERDEVARLLGS
jgi:hydrogenase expression/formation protein HypE